MEIGGFEVGGVVCKKIPGIHPASIVELLLIFTYGFLYNASFIQTKGPVVVNYMSI